MSTRTYTIEYLLNKSEDNLYYGLCDKILISKLSKKKINLDLEKILGKSNIRNIQGVRIKNSELLKEVSNLNNINRLLILLLVIILCSNIYLSIKN